MPTSHERQSQQDSQAARREAAKGAQHLDNAQQEIWAGMRDQVNSARHTLDSWGHGAQEWLQDQDRNVRRTLQNVEAGYDGWLRERDRDLRRAGEQAGHIIPDAIVRARHETDRAAQQIDRTINERERVLYPQEHPATSPSNNEAPRRNAPARAAQQPEGHDRAAHSEPRPTHGRHESSSRHEESRHLAHKPGHEHVTGKALVNRHGETILPDMQIYYE